MQAEALEFHRSSRIRILAVDQAGFEAAVAEVAAGRTIPLLQDTEADGAWADWMAVRHDVVILDGDNRPIGLDSLSTHNLSDPANYDALLDYLRLAAGE